MNTILAFGKTLIENAVFSNNRAIRSLYPPVSLLFSSNAEAPKQKK